MRVPTYISPSGLKTWLGNPEDYYLRYLSDHTPARSLQTKPMAVGSATDAYIKSDLFEKLFGRNHPNWPIYQRDALFEAQVEPHNWDWARNEGEFVFGRYKASGCLADLMIDLGKSASDPQFEIAVSGTIETRRGTVRQGVPLFGKPDVFFIHQDGAHVVLDFKVMGYCAAQSELSPYQGYKLCRDTWDSATAKRSRNHYESHPRYHGMLFKGVEINAVMDMEQVSEDWAIQCSTYGWLMGEQVGVEIVNAVDQICGRRPKLRIAQHRAKTSAAYQQQVIDQYADLWNRIQSGHFFKEMPKADSDMRCQLLDEQSRLLYSPNRTEEDAIFASLTGNFDQKYRPR